MAVHEYHHFDEKIDKGSLWLLIRTIPTNIQMLRISGLALAGLERQAAKYRCRQTLNCFSSKKAADELSYFDRKKAAKAARVEAYKKKVEKEKRGKHRRDKAPRDVMKNQFKSWWDNKRMREAILERKARQAGKNWRIQVAVVLERLPIVLPDKEEWERDYEELHAYLSQFGKEYPKELFGDQQLPEKILLTDEELLGTEPCMVSNGIWRVTFSCFLHQPCFVSAALPEGFRPAPRETPADESGEVQTLERKLKDRVYYTIPGDDNSFPFPIVEVNMDEDESLLEAAKRALLQNGGKKLDLYYASHAPIAVSLTRDDSDDRFFGNKIFYLKVQYDDGQIVDQKEFAWLDRDEIVGRMSQQSGEDQANFYRYML